MKPKVVGTDSQLHSTKDPTFSDQKTNLNSDNIVESLNQRN